jgi:hypothetical protein
LDLIVARQLISFASDASPAVHYEMVLALGCCIEKYLPMFAEVANDYTKNLSNSCRVEIKTDQCHCLCRKNSRLHSKSKMQEIFGLFGGLLEICSAKTLSRLFQILQKLLFPLFMNICYCYLGPLDGCHKSHPLYVANEF